MTDLRDFLTKLRVRYGAGSRLAFLLKLRKWFGEKPQAAPESEIYVTCPLPYVSPPEAERKDTVCVPVRPVAAAAEPLCRNVIDINGTDAWRRHIKKLQDISDLQECLADDNIQTAGVEDFAKSARKILSRIAGYIDKKFKEPEDIDDETSDDIAVATCKFFQDNIRDLLRGCQAGLKHGRGAEREFYLKLDKALHRYLAVVGIYRKDIQPGTNVRDCSEWFKPPYIKETAETAKIGTICEIDPYPYYIPFIYADNEIVNKIIKGECIAFGEPREK